MLAATPILTATLCALMTKTGQMDPQNHASCNELLSTNRYSSSLYTNVKSSQMMSTYETEQKSYSSPLLVQDMELYKKLAGEGNHDEDNYSKFVSEDGNDDAINDENNDEGKHDGTNDDGKHDGTNDDGKHDTINRFRQQIYDLFQRGKIRSLQTCSDAIDIVNRNWLEAKATAGNTWNSVQSRVHDAGQSVRDTATTVIDDTKEKLHEAKATAGNTWNSVKSSVHGAGQSVRDTATTVIADTKKRVHDKYEDFKQKDIRMPEGTQLAFGIGMGIAADQLLKAAVKKMSKAERKEFEALQKAHSALNALEAERDELLEIIQALQLSKDNDTVKIDGLNRRLDEKVAVINELKVNYVAIIEALQLSEDDNKVKMDALNRSLDDPVTVINALKVNLQESMNALKYQKSVQNNLRGQNEVLIKEKKDLQDRIMQKGIEMSAWLENELEQSQKPDGIWAMIKLKLGEWLQRLFNLFRFRRSA